MWHNLIKVQFYAVFIRRRLIEDVQHGQLQYSVKNVTSCSLLPIHHILRARKYSLLMEEDEIIKTQQKQVRGPRRWLSLFLLIPGIADALDWRPLCQRYTIPQERQQQQHQPENRKREREDHPPSGLTRPLRSILVAYPLFSTGKFVIFSPLFALFLLKEQLDCLHINFLESTQRLLLTIILTISTIHLLG